jgi:hypothetical protein
MSLSNRHSNGSAGSANSQDKSVPSAQLPGTSPALQFTPEQIKEFVGLLEVPFDSSVIEWRVTNTSKGNGHPRGQVIPYADQRAYTDRLNAIFSPAGWTRKYTVHTSSSFQRGKDQTVVAKVFVTCDLTIFGIGSHSATGEEWTDNDNAGTSAEAQAFKRACSCFGLGRYLYHFTGTWVDLDDRKRPKTTPKLVGWATPEGWRQGLRPFTGENRLSTQPPPEAVIHHRSQARQDAKAPKGEHAELVRQIEAMAVPLGRGIYRGLLKTVARVWRPHQVEDDTVLQKLLAHMQAAERGLRRLETTLEKTGVEPLAVILQSLGLKALDQVTSLEILQKIVLALEAKAGPALEP